MAKKISDEMLIDISNTLMLTKKNLEDLEERLMKVSSDWPAAEVYAGRICGIEVMMETLDALAQVHFMEGY